MLVNEGLLKGIVMSGSVEHAAELLFSGGYEDYGCVERVVTDGKLLKFFCRKEREGEVSTMVDELSDGCVDFLLRDFPVYGKPRSDVSAAVKLNWLLSDGRYDNAVEEVVNVFELCCGFGVEPVAGVG